MKIKFDHVNITVANLEESIQWYQKLFNFALVESGTRDDGKKWAILAYDDYMICMSEHQNRQRALSYEESKNHIVGHYGIRVSDQSEWQAKVEKYKLKLYYGGVNEYPFSKSWYVQDPSGHSIEVSYTDKERLQFPGA